MDFLQINNIKKKKSYSGRKCHLPAQKHECSIFGRGMMKNSISSPEGKNMPSRLCA